MKALTICNPYPELIMLLEKRVENRDWYMPYRGPLAIHAGRSRDWMEPGDARRYPGLAWGAIVGLVDVVACVSEVAIRMGAIPASLRWLQEHQHVYGPQCIVLDNVRRLSRPVSCRGMPGIWDVPFAVEQEIHAQLANGEGK